MSKSISKKIIIYIRENELSLDEISKATGISIERLKDENVVFDALEFLELCNYLNLEPRELNL